MSPLSLFFLHMRLVEVIPIGYSKHVCQEENSTSLSSASKSGDSLQNILPIYKYLLVFEVPHKVDI